MTKSCTSAMLAAVALPQIPTRDSCRPISPFLDGI